MACHAIIVGSIPICSAILKGVDMGPLIENGEVVKCPKCDSENVIRVHPFDYVKRCNDCFTEDGKHTEFLTSVHN